MPKVTEIQNADVKQVAKSLSVKLTLRQIKEVIMMYPSEQKQDPTGNWSEVVEHCISQLVTIPNKKKANPTSAGQQVKEYLIKLALNDKLPLDMNDLSAETLDKIIKGVKPEDVALNKLLEKAGEYLSFDTPEELIAMIKAIVKAHDAGHDQQFIDDVEEVVVWERVEYEFSNAEFLALIDYKKGILK